MMCFYVCTVIIFAGSKDNEKDDDGGDDDEHPNTNGIMPNASWLTNVHG